MIADNGQRSPDDLVRLVASSPLFQSTDVSKLRRVADDLRWVELPVGDVLFREGDEVDSCYFLVEGVLEVTKQIDGETVRLPDLQPGEILGEMQLLTRGRRTATVAAKQLAGVVQFPREAFDRLLASDVAVVDELSRTIKPRLYFEQLVKVLPSVFGEIDGDTLQDIKKRMTWKHLQRGELLCFQGEEIDSFYILVNGRLQVLISTDGRRRMLDEMAPGRTIGEVGVLTGGKQATTIIASRDSELAEFSQQDFEELVERYPRLLRHMTRTLVQRLQQEYLRVPTMKLSANMLLAPATAGNCLSDFARRLRDATGVARDGREDDSCLLLTSDEVDRRMGISGISQSADGHPNELRLRAWLTEQENRYHVILLQADAEVTEWTRRCIRAADEVLFVARAEADPSTGAVAKEVQDSELAHEVARRKALVLLHDDSVDRPRDTWAWLEEFRLSNPSGLTKPPGRHFHVRIGSESDYQRMGRYITHREVGLVLSGGGARGFAHVGCIRAMRELGIPIDVIAGVSMGSLVSAAYAYDPDRFRETMQHVRDRLPGVLSDVTPPVVSLARGKRFDDRLQAWFGEDTRIEDLWVPYFCVTSNMTRAEIVVHDLGPLWWAVRASGTLPGLSAPVVHDGELLFDGCLLNNLPMDVMRERLGDSLVVAVDVVPPHDLKTTVENTVQSPSGWWLLVNKLNPFTRKVDLPNIVSIMHRAGELSAVYGRRRMIDARYADLYLQPSVEDIRLTDFEHVDMSAWIGYEECIEYLRDWWATAGQPRVGD